MELPKINWPRKFPVTWYQSCCVHHCFLLPHNWIQHWFLHRHEILPHHTIMTPPTFIKLMLPLCKFLSCSFSLWNNTHNPPPSCKLLLPSHKLLLHVTSVFSSCWQVVPLCGCFLNLQFTQFPSLGSTLAWVLHMLLECHIWYQYLLQL